MASFFRKLFGSSRPAAADSTVASDTVPIATPPDVPRPAAGTPRLAVGMAYSAGRVRASNEDSLVAVTGTHLSHDDLPPFGLLVVADGMGGHLDGEKASAAAARTVARHVVQEIYQSLLGDVAPSDRPPLQDVMRSAVAEANRAVSTIAPEGGTTLTAALIIGQQLTLAHVGDSRAYIIGPAGMDRATRDHSLVQRLQELGQLTASEAAVHPQRNILYRALGQGDSLDVDMSTLYLASGSRLLLCSDGLWAFVPEEEILEIVEAAPDLQAACDRLVQAANDAGGADNITAVLVQAPGGG